MFALPSYNPARMYNPFIIPLLVLKIVLLAQTCSSQSTYFTHPQDSGVGSLYSTDEVFTLGSTLNVTWVTNATSYGIWLWQQNVTSNTASVDQTTIYSKTGSDVEVGYVIWTVSTESFNLDASPVFFLNIGPFASLTENLATCHYFNISKSAVAPTASSLTTVSFSSTTSTISATIITSTSSTSSTGTSTSTPAQATSSPSSTRGTPAGSSDNSSSATTKIGLGVGLGIGIPMVLIFAGFLALHIRKTIISNGRADSDSAMRMSLYPKHSSQTSKAYPPSHSSPARYDPTKPYELPGQDNPAMYGPAEMGDHR